MPIFQMKHILCQQSVSLSLIKIENLKGTKREKNYSIYFSSEAYPLSICLSVCPSVSN